MCVCSVCMCVDVCGRVSVCVSLSLCVCMCVWSCWQEEKNGVCTVFLLSMGGWVRGGFMLVVRVNVRVRVRIMVRV